MMFEGNIFLVQVFAGRVIIEENRGSTFPHHALAVSFQQVVHSVRIGKTGVATPQFFRSAPNEHPRSSHCGAIGSSPMARDRLTPLRREETAVAVISGRMSQAEAGRNFGVCAKVVARWARRYGVGGRDAMCVDLRGPGPSLARPTRP